MLDFKQNIKDLIRSKGTTQREVAKNLQITHQALNKILSSNFPNLQTLYKIANVLGVEIRDFFIPIEEKQNIVSGYLEHQGVPVKISSIKDINDFLERVEKGTYLSNLHPDIKPDTDGK